VSKVVVRARRVGFTLLELLVVIAVIVILAAFLFPVFAQVREKARQAACLSNMKQIGTAAMLYVQDWDETYPAGGPTYPWFWVPGPQGRWDYLPSKIYPNLAICSMALRLLPYVRNAQVFFCPNDPTGRDVGGQDLWDPQFTRMCYAWPYGLIDGMSWPTFPSGRPTTRVWRPLGIAEVNRPALLPMVIEWQLFHSRLVPGEARYNLCFADGHAKFSRYVDMWLPDDQKPAIWNENNPREPLDVEKPCQPTCAEEAARMQP
jgi:prepilin-type N-terminal cleavage/methylation domain-containing protein/prepilin-type processing-associated H-X9-DG protein